MENIAENNRLIAEFMGAKPVDVLNGWQKYDKEKEGQAYEIEAHSEYISLQETKDCFFGDTMQYDTSWDWLMPVVEKIEGMNYSVEIYSMGLGNNRTTFYSCGAIVNTHSRLEESKIKSVYKAVVEFIKWYNKQ